MNIILNNIFRTKRLSKSPSVQSFFDDFVENFERSTKLRSKKITPPPVLQVDEKIDSIKQLRNHVMDLSNELTQLETSYREVLAENDS